MYITDRKEKEMETYGKIYTHIPHSSTERFHEGWDIGQDQAGFLNEAVSRTDILTDRLFATTNQMVTPLVYGRSRLWCDVERLDPDQLDGIGQGLCPTRLGRFRRTVGPELAAEIRESYDGWHRMCRETVADGSLVIDCHSFTPEPGCPVDVCIGVNDGQSRPDDETVRWIASQFEKVGFRTALNNPYANSIVFHDRHRSVMIEISKKLYLKENLLEPRPDWYRVGNVIQKVYRGLLGQAES